MTFESWMNFRVGMAIGALIMLVAGTVVTWLRAKYYQDRIYQAKRDIHLEIASLEPYQASKTSVSSAPLIKLPGVVPSTAGGVEYLANWIYIVNMADLVAYCKPHWSYMNMDYLNQEQVAKLAREIRESDKSQEAIYAALCRAYNSSSWLANQSFQDMDAVKLVKYLERK